MFQPHLVDVEQPGVAGECDDALVVPGLSSSFGPGDHLMLAAYPSNLIALRPTTS